MWSTPRKPTALSLPCHIPTNSQACLGIKQLIPRITPATISFYMLISQLFCHQSTSLQTITLIFIAQVLASHVSWLRRKKVSSKSWPLRAHIRRGVPKGITASALLSPLRDKGEWKFTWNITGWCFEQLNLKRSAKCSRATYRWVTIPSPQRDAKLFTVIFWGTSDCKREIPVTMWIVID